MNYNHNYITFYPKLNNDEQEAYIWILKNTKTTSGYNNDKSPEYGIICDWDYGDKINFYSKRPTIINHTLSNYIKLTNIFCSNNEYEVYKECKKNNYKYLFIQPSKDYGSIIKYLNENICKTNNNIINFWEYVTQTLGLISFKSFNSSEHLRLIYIGNTYKGKTPIPYAILEVVDGFNITIKADPYSKAEISIAITLDGTNHIYKQSHITNKDGITTFTVPYTTNYISNRIRTDEKYKISCIKKDKIVRKTISIQE